MYWLMRILFGFLIITPDWLNDNGDKVKVSIWFRGREMQHRELGMDMLDRIEKLFVIGN
jgi:translation initiation factor IF-3